MISLKSWYGKECHIIVGSDDKEGQIVVTIVTDKGEIFECRYNDFNKNVNIEGVYPILYKELKLTVKDSKQFTKDLKTISKVSEFVSFEIEKGSDRLRVNYITELGISDTDNKYGELFVQLSEPSNFSYRSDNRLSKVLSCLDGWNGEIYFTKEYSYFDFNVSDYTDDMIEVTGLDLESITSKVKQDSPKELKVIQDIKLYDKTGKIVFTYDNGSIDTVVEATFNGDSVLQSVLQKINENM